MGKRDRERERKREREREREVFGAPIAARNGAVSSPSF